MYFRDSIDEYYDYYIIEKGDSLYKIGRKFSVNPKLLAIINGLNMDDYIYPDQVLMIPKANYSYYITKSGDTLESVADTFDINVMKLVDCNKSIYLQEGQLLVKKKI